MDKEHKNRLGLSVRTGSAKKASKEGAERPKKLKKLGSHESENQTSSEDDGNGEIAIKQF